MKSKDIICITCGNKFFAGSTAKYCSDKCSPRYKKLNKNVLPIATRFIGYLSELKIASDLVNKEYELFWSVSVSNSCDLVASKNGKLVRVEIKTAHRDTNGRINSAKADPTKYDVLALFVDNSEVLYFDTKGNPFHF